MRRSVARVGCVLLLALAGAGASAVAQDLDREGVDVIEGVAQDDAQDDAVDDGAPDTDDLGTAAVEAGATADVVPDDPDAGDGDTLDDADVVEATVRADEFLLSDWAPDEPVDTADDTLDVDTDLDPQGLGWVAVEEPAPAAAGGGEDHAGPSRILVMRPRPVAGSVPASPGRAGAGPDRAYSYGGQPISAASAPWQAQLYRSRAPERPGLPLWKAQHNCGGALIAPGWIVTAAHCIDDIVGDREAGWRIRFGAADLARDDGVTYAVDRWVRHSGYRNAAYPQPPPNMYANDIGLVHFAPDAQTRASAGARPPAAIALYRSAIKGGDEVTAIGWGMTQNAAKSFSAVPLKVDLRVMDTALCQSRPGYGPERVGAAVICAAREGQKTCRGDSGGPVILTNGIAAQLVGVVSWGKSDCSGDGRPSVFTRIETHLAWIEQALRLPETRASLP